jgi:purine-nucleoside phosphorylase
MIRQPVPVRPADQDPYHQAHTAAQHLRDLTGGSSHQIAVILGSGWAPAADCFGTADYEASLSDLPGFTPASAPGHGSIVRSATMPRSGTRALVFAGRTHLHEGHGTAQAVHAVRTAISAGCGIVVLTNGAGGIRPGYRPGQPVLISDHINLTACSPLTGPRFTDLTDVYSPRLRALCRQVQPGITDGVYLQLPGPHYETPAEIRWPASSAPTSSACPPRSKPSPPASLAPRYWASPSSPTLRPASPASPSTPNTYTTSATQRQQASATCSEGHHPDLTMRAPVTSQEVLLGL